MRIESFIKGNKVLTLYYTDFGVMGIVKKGFKKYSDQLLKDVSEKMFYKNLNNPTIDACVLKAKHYFDMSDAETCEVQDDYIPSIVNDLFRLKSLEDEGMNLNVLY